MYLCKILVWYCISSPLCVSDSKILLEPNILWNQNFFFGPNIFLFKTFFWPKISFNKNYLWRDKTERLNLRLSKLPSAKVLLKLEFDTKDQVLLLDGGPFLVWILPGPNSGLNIEVLWGGHLTSVRWPMSYKIPFIARTSYSVF